MKFYVMHLHGRVATLAAALELRKKLSGSINVAAELAGGGEELTAVTALRVKAGTFGGSAISVTSGVCYIRSSRECDPFPYPLSLSQALAPTSWGIWRISGP